MRSHERAEMKGDGVKVLVRLRPLSQSEVLAEDSTRVVRIVDDYTCTICPQKNRQRSEEACTFTFDSVLKETATQDEVFQRVGIPIIENVLGGYNSTIFAYGQTGAGKTHTMIGNPDFSKKNASEEGGLAPRVFQYLFRKITEAEQRKRDKDGNPEELHFSVRCSVLEIYNENITDLLNPKETNLPIREDVTGGAFVDGLREVHVQNAREALQLLFTGASNRKTAQTRANNKSSRSHYIYTCIVECTAKSEDGNCQTRRSRLNLVDLAGSERNRFSRATNDQLKEACHINKSLSTLGRVIKELLECQRHGGGHIPYRDSKLTYLLQESLGGNAKTTIIANITPSSISYQETLSTLQFVKRAKNIRNNARVNEDSKDKQNIDALNREIERLKETVRNLKAGTDTPLLQENERLKEQLRAKTLETEQLQRDWTSARERYENLQGEQKKLQKQVTVLQDDRAAMRKSLNVIMSKFSDAQASAVIADEKAGKVSAIEREVLMRELQMEEIERLQGGEVIEELQLNLATMTQQLVAGRDREHEMLLDLEMAREVAERQQQEIDVLRKELSTARGAAEEHHASLAAVSEQLLREKDASAGLEAALDRTRMELGHARDDLVHARDGVSLSRDEASRKEQELESLRQQQTDSEKEMNSSRAEIKRLEEELTKAAVLNARNETLMGELRQQLEDLRNGYDELVAEVDDRENEISYLKKMTHDAEARLESGESAVAQVFAEREQIRRTNFALASMMDNISDVIREAEVSTPLGIVHSIRGYEEKQGFDMDSGGGMNGVRTKFSPSPEGFSARSLFSSFGDFIPSPPVDVGGYTHDF